MNPWRALSGLSRQTWIVCSATLVNRMGTMARPFLALYLVEHRGFPEAQAGFMLACYGAAALMVAPFAGRACDSFGALRVMRGSLVLAGLLLMLFPLATGFTAMLALVFVWAGAAEAYRPANLAMLTGLAPPGQTRAVLALNRMAINLGMSVGPVAGGVLAGISYPAVFVVDGVMSILAGMVLWTGIGPINAAPRPPAPDIPHVRVNALGNRDLLYVLAGIVPAIAVMFQCFSTMPLFFVRDLHMAPSTYGLLMLVNTILILLIEVPLNVRMQSWRHRHSLGLAAFLFGLGFGGLALATGIWSVAATIVVWTFGEMILLPGSAAYVSEIAPPGQSGEYMGLYSMAVNVAFVIGPWLGTAVLQHYGATTLWVGSFFSGCLSAVWLSRVREGGSGSSLSPLAFDGASYREHPAPSIDEPQ